MSGKTSSARKVLCGTVLLILIAVGGGIVLWQLLPQRQREALVSAVEGSSSGIGKESEVPPPTYQFMQCTNETRCCNGLTSNCDLRVNDILYAGIHNANAAAQDGFRVAPNHFYSLEFSLDYGYRAINMDIGNCDGAIKLVHSKCKLGTRDPYEVFNNINIWLDNNPTEVILITIQIDSSAGGKVVKHSAINKILTSVNGLPDKLWTKGSNDEWPTLDALVQSNRRVLFFTYNGEHCYNPNVLCPPGFMDWFRYGAETEYSFYDVQQIRETTRSCNITRGWPNAPFLALNVFVTLPSFTQSDEVLNKKEFLQTHLETCSNMNDGRSTNIVFVDFWHQGDLPEVVQIHNEIVALDWQQNRSSVDNQPDNTTRYY